MSNPISRVTSRWSSGMGANLEATPDGHYILSVGRLGRGKWQSIILNFEGLNELMEPVRPAYEAQVEPTRYEIRRRADTPVGVHPWFVQEVGADKPLFWAATHIVAVLELESLLKEGKA